MGSYFVVAPGRYPTEVQAQNSQWELPFQQSQWEIWHGRASPTQAGSSDHTAAQLSGLWWPGQSADPGEVLTRVSKLCKSHYFSSHPAPHSSALLLGGTVRLCIGILVWVGSFLPTSHNSLHSGGVQGMPRVHVCGSVRFTCVVPFIRQKVLTFLKQLCAPSPFTCSRGASWCFGVQHLQYEGLHKAGSSTSAVGTKLLIIKEWQLDQCPISV